MADRKATEKETFSRVFNAFAKPGFSGFGKTPVRALLEFLPFGQKKICRLIFCFFLARCFQTFWRRWGVGIGGGGNVGGEGGGAGWIGRREEGWLGSYYFPLNDIWL